MTANLPSYQLAMQADWDLDTANRGAFAGTGEAQPATRNTKTNGWLPITGIATGFVNTQASSATGPLRGTYWGFRSSDSAGYDMTSKHRIVITNWQYNAPNRIQITTAANDGLVARLGSGSGDPPTNYRTYQIAGNDKVGGSAREAPKMIVLDAQSTDYEAEIGTFQDTDVQCFGFGTVRYNISGTSTCQYFFARMYVMTTEKGSSDIPYFTGDSEWKELVDAIDGTDHTDKISHEWAYREGNVYSFACPVQIGDGATSTQFNDNGAIVFWAANNQSNDPRVRVTDKAFRVHSNLRNNDSDTITLTGKYNVGNSNPAWDFNQNNASSITITGASFQNIGGFDLGGSVSGAATFTGNEEINIKDTDVDIDDSVFRNPLSGHLLTLP